MKIMTENFDSEESNCGAENPDNSLWGKYGSNMVLCALFLYVILLAIGTAAEVFGIDLILDWMIYNPSPKN